MKEVAAIVAASASSRGIGQNGKLPWNLPGDMAHFKRVTTEPPMPNKVNAVVMGRKTWDSIPPKFRPLPNRTNVVLTRNPSLLEEEGVIVANSLAQAQEKLEKLSNLGNVFVIGGAQIYKQSIESGWVKRVFYTQVSPPKDGSSAYVDEKTSFDAFFPELNEAEWICAEFQVNPADKENGSSDATVHADSKSGIQYRFLDYSRKQVDQSTNPLEGPEVNQEEMQYLDLCREIIEKGVRRGDRTGTGTLSKFGAQMRFSLRDGTLPLLTTKRTFWRGVAEELLWFVSGNTNGNDLAAKDIHIWDGNGSREFLDSRGLSHREVGDLGPVYGFQWRHFGAKYVDMHTDYTGEGVDQLAECIEKIKNNPTDRRIIMSAWNPADLDLMALPPCHMFCQFYVDTDRKELSCQMYQRSADMGLGVPFNIASYALLTHMMAHVTGLKAGDFVHTIGDAHVYLNHVDALKEQLERPPRAFPKLNIKREVTDIDEFTYGDFEVVGYKPHKSIQMKMAV